MPRKPESRQRAARPSTSDSLWARRNQTRTTRLLLLLVVVAVALTALGFYWWANEARHGRPRNGAADVQPVPLGAPPVDPIAVLRLPRKLPPTVDGYKTELRFIGKRLLESLPDRPEAHVQMALIWLDLGQDQKALDSWRDVLTLAPTFALAHLGIGTILADRGENDKAIGPLRAAIKLQPALENTYRLLTEVLLRQGKADEALTVAQACVQRFPSVCDNQFWLGQCYLQLKDYQQARRCHEEAVRLDPSWTLSYYPLALACARLGKTEDAARYRARFAALKAGDLQADREQTKAYDDLSVQRKVLVKRHFVAGSLQLRFGNPRRAEAHWLRAAAIAPDDTISRKALVALYQQQSRVGGELRILVDLIRLEPDNPSYPLRKGRLLSLRAEWHAAESTLAGVVQRWPDSAEAHLRLAQLYLRSGADWTAAETHAEKAVSLRKSSGSLQLLAAIRAQRGDLPGARSALRQARNIDPENQEVQHAYEQLRGAR